MFFFLIVVVFLVRNEYFDLRKVKFNWCHFAYRSLFCNNYYNLLLTNTLCYLLLISNNFLTLL